MSIRSISSIYKIFFTMRWSKIFFGFRHHLSKTVIVIFHHKVWTNFAECVYTFVSLTKQVLQIVTIIIVQRDIHSYKIVSDSNIKKKTTHKIPATRNYKIVLNTTYYVFSLQEVPWRPRRERLSSPRWTTCSVRFSTTSRLTPECALDTTSMIWESAA